MNRITPDRDPVSEPIATLLDVFEARSEALRFPEVDHQTLLTQAEGVRQAAAELQRCEQALAEARRVLDEQQEALLARAERGLAYARVFAQDDPELHEALGELELQPRRAASKRAAKKAPRRPARSRRRKADEKDDSVTELPFSGDETEAAVA